jgi:cobaltochelatase CobT
MFEKAARRAGYMAYSRKFDRVLDIDKLVGNEVIPRLQAYFEARGYEGESEAVEERAWAIREIEVPPESVVTFLVELSGSAQNGSIAEMAKAVLAASIALEGNGTKVEVLGYTTSGGEGPRKEWNGDKVVTYPGRLSELRHVVVKERGAPAGWSAGRILSMVNKKIGHENIDGEALEWAVSRAAAGTAKPVLVFVTDDTEPQCEVSQRFADRRDFLKDHLKEIVSELEASEAITFVPVVVTNDPKYAAGRNDVYSDPVFTESTKTAAILDAVARGLSARLEAVREPEPEPVSAPSM